MKFEIRQTELPEKLSQHPAIDVLPDPEPAVPSLAEPDAGVFQHEPGAARTPAKESKPA